MSGNMNTALESEKSLIFSYLALRRAVGVLGAMLPVVVSVGACLIDQTGIQSSISSYYYTVMRNVFVGTLWAMGVFLMFYKGYECADAVASRLGGVFAIGVSLFPTAPDVDPTVGAQWIGRIHFAFAALFFMTLAYMSLFLFTKTHRDKPKIPITAYLSLFRSAKKHPYQMKIPPRRKLQRNVIYYFCGVTMLACLLGIVLYFTLFKNSGAPSGGNNPVFWLEAIAIFAFGISWFIKGETLFKDKVG